MGPLGISLEVIIALQHKLRQTAGSIGVDNGRRAEETSAAPLKDLYEIGEMPPLGHVPAQMYAWAIRKERHGPPEKSMQCEVVPTWPIAEDEVLVYVMAGGVNYNGVWAGLASRSRRSTCTRIRSMSPARMHPASFGRSAPK